MSSEYDKDSQECLTVDQDTFFDFDAYYGEGSHHNDGDPNMPEPSTEEHDIVSQPGGPGPSQPQGAPWVLSASDLHEMQPILLPPRGQG